MTKFPARWMLIAPLGLALAACGSQKTEPAAQAETEAVSTDFTIENPTDPAVPVDLPSTALTSAPVDQATPETK